MIGLAGIALVLGVMIAISNLLPPSAVSSASGTPVASASPTHEASRTPRPTRRPDPLRELTLDQATPEPTPEPRAALFSGWIRAEVDLIVRRTPGLDAYTWGVLEAGAAARATESGEFSFGTDGWLMLEEPFAGGWVATLSAGASLVERYPPPANPSTEYLMSVGSGATGFLAFAQSESSTLGRSSVVALTSSDGQAWTRSATGFPRDTWVPAPAWGPLGWLAAVTTYWSNSPQTWLYQSGDGRNWTTLGRMTATSNSLLGSDAGYLLTAYGDGTRPVPTHWFSEDGLFWQEAEDPGFAASSRVNVVAVPGGFYAWDARLPVPQGDLRAAFSADGQTWVPISEGPGGSMVLLASVGSRVIGLDLSEDLEIRTWDGSISDGLTWQRDSDGDAPFAGAMVSSLASDGQVAYAFGWDSATERPLVWVGTDAGFSRTGLPSGFEGLPHFGVAGPSGVALVGARPNLRAENPIFWHRTRAGGWAAEARPVIPVTPDPVGADCPPRPTDLLEFMGLATTLGPFCYADQPITLRAWSTGCEWCSEVGGDPGAEPAWLTQPSRNLLVLSPIQSAGGDMSVVLAPALVSSQDLAYAWVELTGHFDDPAAGTCRASPATVASPWYSGAWQVVLICRQQFVVSAVRVVDGP